MMIDYQAMYYELFNSLTAAIEILQQAQQKTEELYISGCDSDIPPAEHGRGQRADRNIRPDSARPGAVVAYREHKQENLRTKRKKE